MKTLEKIKICCGTCDNRKYIRLSDNTIRYVCTLHNQNNDVFYLHICDNYQQKPE